MYGRSVVRALFLSRGALSFARGGSALKRVATSAMSTMTELANPLLEQEGLPKFSQIEPTHVVPGISRLAEDLERDFMALEAALAASPAPTYEASVEEAEAVGSKLGFAWGVVGHLKGVKDSSPLREAHAEMQPKVVELVTKLGQSKALYEALEKLDVTQLSPTQRRVVEAQLRSMKLSGVALEGAAKARYNEIQLELSKAGTDFANNVLDATKAFSMKLEDKADVKGLPASALAAAAQKTGQGATADDGPWTLGLDIPSYLPAMKHLENRAIREKLYRAFLTRAAEPNAVLVDRILALKQEKARLLGFDNFAQVSLASKMADDAAAVDELHDLLSAKALPAAKAELADLDAYAKAKGFPAGETLMHWDVAFWSEQLREERYGFSDEELRPYFALPAVLEGLFALIDRLFGVKVRAADGEADVWNKDVRYFVVDDGATGKRVASFYLDPYARPEDKRGGAWMDVCVGKSKRLKRDVPTAYLTCNGSPPIGDRPSLMTFNEVETLYHEMGHGLQHMLTKVSDGDAAGINGVEWDAVELPSQFMENWLYDKATLYSFAKHYETGAPLPAHYFEKLCGAKTFQAGMGMSRQICFGALDIELHRVPELPAGQTVFDVQRAVFDKYSHMAPLPEDRFLCAFSHIFAGGYAAGYYSYKWAEVMSADAFAAFEEAGLDDDAAVRAVGKKFRETVLALGGGTHPSEVFNDFRGRAPSPEALLRHSGLA